MISQSKHAGRIEPGRFLINFCYRLRTAFEEKKRNKQKREGIRMAVLSGSIRRVK